MKTMSCYPRLAKTSAPPYLAAIHESAFDIVGQNVETACADSEHA
jgi:hypothetical protein